MNTSCVNCQGKVEGNDFCPHCGLAQKCLHCHTEFEAKEKFCGNCGTQRVGPQTKLPMENGTEVSPSTPPVSQQHDINYAQTTEVGQTPPPPQPKKSTMSPLTKWGIGIAVAIALFFLFDPLNLSTENRVKKTANDYFTALENVDQRLLEKTLHPGSYQLEFYEEYTEELAYELNDTVIELIDIVDISIDERNGEAEVIAFVSISLIETSEEHREEVTLEMKRFGKEWYVYDTY